jgi:hypothetical protein
MNSPKMSALKALKSKAASRAGLGGLLKHSTNRPSFLTVDVNV